MAGDAQGAAQTIKEADDYARNNPGMAEGRDLSDAWQRGDGVLGGIAGVVGEFAKDWREAPSVVGGIRATAKNVRAMGEGLVEQVPNMIAPTVGLLGGTAAGGAAGSAVPVVGNVAGGLVGGWAGASAGNALVEGGGMAQEAISKAGINPQDAAAVEKYLKANGDQILGQAGVKGGIIGAVDVATMGIASKLLNGPARAAASRALADMGVDATNKIAVKAAMETPEFAAKIAGDAAYKAAMTGAGSMARNAGAAAMDPAGEFTGELVGQGVATGDWDTKNAALEAFSSMGQSGVMFAGQKAYQSATRPRSGDAATPPAADPTTSPGAADPTRPGPTAPAAPIAPDWATSPGAAAPNPYGGIDFTREVDTSGLSLADPADTIASRLKPSEIMGLNPQAGALSREVAAFVDAQPFTEVTPIESRPEIGAQRRIGEQPIIDVDAREVIDPQQTIAARLAGPPQTAPIQQAVQQLPYNPATQGDSLADQAPQAIQAATQRTQAGAAQADSGLNDPYAQAWDSLDAESRASVARSAGSRGSMARNVASKGWGDLSPNLRASISTVIESSRSPGGVISMGNQPQGTINVGNTAAPQTRSVPAAAGAPNALAKGERGAGLSGNGDGVGGQLDGTRQRVTGSGAGEVGLAPVAGRAGVAPALTHGAAPILQNRNRSNPSSIAQMQGIAADPDYGRLGFSRDFANGAPVVAGGTVPADQFGRPDVAVASDGRRIPVQYAVVEASDVLASNQVDGTPNADYGNQSVTRIRAIAGNGRIAGLQRAYGMGTSDGYTRELLGDALHGVSPDVIRSMRQPVLVRVMPADQVTQDIGDVSNTTGNLSLSPVEQANNDAQRVSLDALQFSEDGAITSDTVRQFVRAMPQAEQGGLIDTNGQPTKQAVDRINAAVFARAYGNDQLIRLFAQAQDPEARNVLSALAQVAPKMARLEGAGALDIRDVVTQAAEIAVNARREGRPLANAAAQIDMTADPMVGEVLQLFARNARTVRPVVDALGAAADFAYTEANKPAEDMFGAVPKATRSDVLGSLSPQNEQASQANLEQPAGVEPVQVDAVQPAADAGAAADAPAAEAGRPAEADREALTLEAQTEEDLRAKAEREDAATSQAAAEKAAEQERLRREAEARDNKARADATVDDFQLGQTAEQQMSGMDDLFGMSAPESEQAQPQSSRSANSDAQMADAIDAIGDSLKRSLADAAAKARATAEDWASRQYRKSGRSVTFEGDGPSRSESVSVDGANAARRDDVVRTSNALGDAAQSLVDSLDRKGARAFLSEMLSLHTDSDAAFESTLISRLGLDGVARKGAMTSTDATKAVLSAVKQYRDAIRNADSAEGRPEWMDELFGTDSDAQQEQSTNTRRGRIEDSGQVLEGARKMYAANYAAKLSEGMDMDVAAVPLSKSWPEPDYQRLLDEGADPWAVAFMHAVRDEIPTKPSKGWKLKGWVQQVENLRDLASRATDGRNTIEFIKTTLDEKTRLAGWAGRVELYEAVGHSQSLKGVKLEKGEYSLYGGQKFNPPKVMWTVNFPKAGSSWGTDVASGDTKAEAIEKFKKWHAQQSSKPAESTKGTSFDIYTYRRNPGEFVVGKRLTASKSIDLKKFGSLKEAREYMAANQEELERLLEQAKDVPSERRETNAPRVGDDHRNGADVTSEQFREAFGFRGEQFGASMPQSERQANMNMAYDALMDLAGVVGIPPRALSLNGELGLAFGARGHGGKRPAAAHYEQDTTGAVTPNRVVINLTRKNGAGSLAHEWFHAVDNYFGRMRGMKAGFLTESYAERGEGVRPEMVNAFRELMGTISRTGMKERSSKLDATRIKDYWSTGLEMAARSFESYVIAKLQDQNKSNDYLANVVNETLYAMQGAYPYPSMGEMPAIRAAFDNFFQTVQTKETEGGNVAMFSRTAATGNLKGALYQRGQTITTRDSDAQHTAAQQITDTIAARWKNAPADIIVARNMQDASIPEAVRKHDAELKSQGATGEPRGFIYKGRVYLLSDHLKTTSDVIEVLFHETLGHYGLRGVFGDSLKSILQQVGTMRRADVVAKAREYGLFDAEKVGENASDRDVWASMTDKQRLDAAEEVLAEMAQTRPDLGFVKRVISAIRNWLRANVPGFQNLRMKDADIVQAYILPARGWVERGVVAASANRQVANEPGARYSAREQDLLFSGDEAPTSGRPGYETDLFGDPLPISAGRLAPARPARTEVRGDAQPTTGLSDTAAPEGSYRVRTIIGQEVSRKLGADAILTPEQAAQATAYLYRSAVERFDAIVTDKNGKPLAVVGSFKGALTQTSIYPGTIIAEAVRVPGAARIWFSHNHPSGKSALSDADKMLNRTLSSVFDGTSIEPMGTLAVTGKSFEHVSPDGRVTSGATPAPSSSINVPVIERELDPGNKDSDITLDSPAKAREHGSALYRDAGDPGLMILDTQHRVAAWVPVRGAMRGKLMGTGGLDAVYRAVSESNAGSVIIIHGGELDAGRGDGSVWSIAQNLGAALRGTDVHVLDIIDVNRPRSAAETGANLVAGSVFSRTQSPQSLPPTIEVDGKTRPTTNSNGQPIASTEEGVRNFWQWFGDSKAVDADGKPLVVYHGTKGNFDTFDAAKQGASDFGASGRGFYFSEDAGTAGAYATLAPSDGAPNVMPVYLAISNPLELGALLPQNEEQSRLLTDLAKSAGHDGIVVRGADGVIDEVIAFSPKQIKSAIGNNGNFDPADPRITFSRTQGAAPAQPTAPSSAWGDLKESAFDDVIFKMQDKMIDLKRVVESITKSVGAVADNVNAYLQEELFHGRAASRVAEFGNREMKPLMNQMRLAGLTLEDVEEFLHARHAKEANAVIAQRNPGNADMQDGGSGMTNADADAYFANLAPGQRSKLEAAAKKVDAIIADTRKLYVQYGLEDQAVVDGWTGMFKNYIPLMRENKDGGMGIGQGFSVKGKEVKGRTGSKRKVVDIMANIAAQREKVIVRGEKNRVAQALVGLAWANPNKAFWEVRSQAPTERVYDEKLKKVVDRPDPMFKSRDNVLSAKVKDSKGNVTEQFVVFNEDNPRAVRLASAMKNLDAGNLEGLLGVSAKITRYFSAINTQYNPVFGVVNLVRDVQGAMVNLAATPLAGKQVKIAKETIAALSGIYGDIRKTRKGGQAASPWAKLWEQMQEDGGTTGYRELFKTSADREASLKAILNPDAWMDSKWGKMFTADGRLKAPMSVAKKGADIVFDWLSDYNEAMENGVRLAAYKAALDQGMSRAQAASLSKNLTVNFNRKGQVGMQAGAVYAFFNAAMQGTARIGQTLFDMEGGDIKTIRLSSVGKKVVYGGVLLGVMQALALSAAGFDDEDPPEFLRERSLIIPTGGKTYISIPMPLGLHVIPGLGRHATEFALSGFSKPAERAVSVVGMFADAFNPIGNAGLSMQTVAPTALDPFAALSENRDWTGKPIARTSFNKAEPGHNQWKDTATGFSKTIAEAINWLSGGNEYVAGAFSPTPDQIDYLIAQVGGGVAREVSKVMQTGSSITSGEELPTYKMPLLGRFVGSANGQASQGSAFYANLNKLNALETEIKGLRKDGKYEEAAALVRERPESSLIAFANKAERDVQKLRRDKRELIANDAGRDAVRAKEDQITSVMTRLNELTKKRTESVQ